MEEGKRIEFALRFTRPMQSTARAKFEIAAKEQDVSTVSWIFDSPSKFPMSLLTPVFKILLGRDLAKGLVNLKGILEKN
jgi:hypothetical protein